MTITNSLARSSCTKCVEVLQELVSGLQQENAGENDNNSNTNKNTNTNKSNSNSNTKNEPSPLTLLKAIARSSHQQRNEYDQWGQQQQQQRRNNNNRHNRHDHHQHHHRQQHNNNKPKRSEKLKIEVQIHSRVIN
jgi:hypothetical protein